MNMPLNFGMKVEEKSGDVIPKNTLLWCHLGVRGFKNSRTTQGRYLDIELTVAEGQPYAKRKIWDKIADPFDALNSEEWRTMAYGTIRRILEAVKGAHPSNPNSYGLNRLEDLNGLVVPVIVDIEKGKGEYTEEKNRVEYLSPHSSTKKICECFRLLSSGVNKYGKDEKPGIPQQANMFAGAPVASPVAAPQFAQQPVAQTSGPQAWLAPSQPTPAAPQQGFQQGQAPAQQQGQFAEPVAIPQQAQIPMAQPAIPATNYPSNPLPAQFPVGSGSR